jgi:hypothetical protein
MNMVYLLALSVDLKNCGRSTNSIILKWYLLSMYPRHRVLLALPEAGSADILRAILPGGARPIKGIPVVRLDWAVARGGFFIAKYVITPLAVFLLLKSVLLRARVLSLTLA